jgi:dephospho-CoA kinase
LGLQVVGLTGGIACGKSTVARLLDERGIAVVDADEVARAVVEPGQPAHADIVATFGSTVLDPGGRIDRTALGRVVFSDPARRARLEAITHPRILEESRRRFSALEARGEEVAVYEAALLVETGRVREFAALLVVSAPPAVQLERLVRDKGMSEADARARLAAQMPLAEKEAFADAVVVNDADMGTLRVRTDAAWNRIASKLGRPT